MLVIRLQPIGRKNQKKFRLILQERTQAPKAKAQEILGSYDPHLKERKDQVTLKTDRIKYWLGFGAQPSNTVHNMLIEFGVIEGDKRRSVFNKKAEPEAVVEEAAPAEEAPATEEKKEEAPAEEAKAE
jgi:small subunit ribosomal protein S16